MTSNKVPELEAGLQAAIDYYRESHLGEAISLLRKLGRRFPASAKLWGYLGFLYREAKDLAAAVRCFRRAVRLSPKSERASLGLFYSLWHLKRPDEALKELVRFAKVGRPVAYLGVLGSSGGGGAEDTTPTLLARELSKAEAAYREVEAHPHESITEIDDADTLRELINA
jgi:tetratricopeptide (TPR) repeat protein